MLLQSVGVSVKAITYFTHITLFLMDTRYEHEQIIMNCKAFTTVKTGTVSTSGRRVHLQQERNVIIIKNKNKKNQTFNIQIKTMYHEDFLILYLYALFNLHKVKGHFFLPTYSNTS